MVVDRSGTELTQTAVCLRDLGATADVLEQWIDTCRDRAAEIVG